VSLLLREHFQRRQRIFFTHKKLLGRLLIGLGMVSGAGTAYANNIAQITISNTWTSQANYSASLSSRAGSATPAFANLSGYLRHSTVRWKPGQAKWRYYFVGGL
jgi:hypothetical protein